MAKKTEWMGAFKVFEVSYQRIAENAAPIWFFVGVFTAAHVVSMLIQGKSVYNDNSYQSYADAIMLLFVLPVTVYALARAHGKTQTISEFMQLNLKKLLFLLLTSLLTALVVVGSVLLFIVPVVWTVGWFLIAVYASVDQDKGPIQALKESKRISQDHKAKVWGVLGVSLLVSIAGSIIALVPYVGVAAVAFASAWTTVASAHLYVWLKTQS